MRLQQARPISESAPQSPERDGSRADAEGFRPDLEGLRGLAILAVLVFHAGVPGVAGGFVGVDVFFVLSGFLITGLLLREHETRGRIRLSAFYARRARRLLPAAAVSLVAILCLSWLLLPPLDVPGVADDVAAAIASVGNIRFAIEANDYFATDVTRSPVLHFWSLGVEEQFYLVWPALLILAMRVRRARVGAFVALVAVLIVSYAAAFVLTTDQPAWAFYSLPTRAWQLALGGLLAAGALRLERMPAAAIVPLGWLGLVAVVAGVFLIDPSMPYPGTAALLPSLGAAGLILAGQRAGSPGRLLAVAPLRFLGRISYSLYLVHWPILILPAATLGIGQELPLPIRLALAGLSIVAGWASYRWVEKPFHRGQLVLRVRPGRILAVAGASIVAILLVAVNTGAIATQRLDDPGSLLPTTASVDPGSGPLGVDPGAAPGTEDPGVDPGAVDPSGDPPPADPGGEAGGPEGTPQPGDTLVPDPTDEPEPSASPGSSATPRPSPTPYAVIPLPPDVRPKLSKARGDVERLDRDHCTLETLDVQPRDCVYGNPRGKTVMALIGDSHAAEWFPALEKIATDRGWKLIVHTKVSCRFIDMPFESRVLHREYTECERWRELVVDRLARAKPDLVIVSVARTPEPLHAADDSPTKQGHALARLLDRIPGTKAIIVDTPQFTVDPPSCISSHIRDTGRCAMSWSRAFGWRHLILERTAAKDTGATIVDLSTTICPGHYCPAVQGKFITFRDYHHMTATYAASLSDLLAAGLPAINDAAESGSSQSLTASSSLARAASRSI